MVDNKEENNEQEVEEEVAEKGASVPIEWHMPEGAMTPFATNMLVQPLENDFKISFFEIKPAIRLDKAAPMPTSVRADCVASVIVTQDRLAKFVEVLQSQLEIRKKKTK